MENQKTYKWWGYSVGDYPIPEGWCCPNKIENGKKVMGTCDHAAKVPGHPNAYEVGVYQKPDGTWGIIFDFYNNGYGLMPFIGGPETNSHGYDTDIKNASKLVKAYTMEMVKQVALQQGWTCHQEGENMIVSIYDPETEQMGYLTVGPGGVEASNFTGAGCQMPTQMMAQALGIERETEIKVEFYDVKQALYEKE